MPGNGPLPSIGARFPASKCPVLPGETVAETVAVRLKAVGGAVARPPTLPFPECRAQAVEEMPLRLPLALARGRVASTR